MSMPSIFRTTSLTVAASYLTEGVLGWFKAYYNETTQGIKFKTYTNFIKALKATYNNPNKRATVEQKLLALCQNNKNCTTYYTEFSAYVNVLEYNNYTKISFFKKRVNIDLQVTLTY